MPDKTEQILLVLQRARQTLAGHWTQGTSARTASGQAIDPTAPMAVSWCPMGAIMKHCPDKQLRFEVWFRLVSAFEEISSRHMSNVVVWNDSRSRTEEEVLALLDYAIARAQNKQPSQKETGDAA